MDPLLGAYGPSGSDVDNEAKQRARGVHCFSLLGLVSLAAFCCSIYSYAYCDFVGREVTLNPKYSASGSSIGQACEDLGYVAAAGTGTSVCSTLLAPHAIGFSYWQATLPVDQHVCLTYTQLTPFGYVTPHLDSKFHASSWMSVMGYVFGGLGWFTIAFANCCRIDQVRLQSTSCTFLLASLFTGLSLLMFKSSACDKDFFAPFFVSPSDMNDPAKMEEYDSVVSDVSCSLSKGSNCAIASTVLYLLCAVMVRASVVPDYASQRAYQRGAPPSGEQEQGEQEQRV